MRLAAALTRQAAGLFEAAVVSGLNILVAGGTQAGNPTNPQDIYCEDTRPEGREGASP